jgi:hypothetical protein
MAAIALNTFKTIRAGITTNTVGIYTCPIGVATVILLAQVTNVSAGSSIVSVTAVHSRSDEPQEDYQFANAISIPPNDSINLIPDGKLVLETGDSIKISADQNNGLNIILSVLETAKN